jgi:hypothetical protein
MAEEDVAWLIQLRRGSDFWQEELLIFDKTNQPVTFIDATLTITPDDEDEDEVVWSVSNGRIILAAGAIQFNVSIADIASYSWKTGHYKLSVTYGYGKIDAQYLSHAIEILD